MYHQGYMYPRLGTPGLRQPEGRGMPPSPDLWNRDLDGPMVAKPLSEFERAAYTSSLHQEFFAFSNTTCFAWICQSLRLIYSWNCCFYELQSKYYCYHWLPTFAKSSFSCPSANFYHSAYLPNPSTCKATFLIFLCYSFRNYLSQAFALDQRFAALEVYKELYHFLITWQWHHRPWASVGGQNGHLPPTGNWTKSQKFLENSSAA